MSTEKFEYTREWTDAEAFPLLSFSRNWENPDDYPTIETDEMKVREDMQSLHDEVKDYLNEQLIPRVIAEDATVEAWQAQENEHAEAEAARVEAEEARVTAEQERETAETEREKTIAKVENLTVSSEALEYGEPAAVEVTTDPETGGLNMHFGLPMGKNGLDFLPVIEGDDVPEGVEAWIDPSVEAEPGGTGGGGTSGGRGVHIGPEPPTNGETVWIDTDDTEGSFYTAKQVDALLAGKVSMELLWENASPISSFSPQTIALDLSEYYGVLIVANYSENYAAATMILCPVGKGCILQQVRVYNSGYVLMTRNVAVRTDGVQFYANEQMQGGTYTADNAIRNVPIRIYGIKGVTSNV